MDTLICSALEEICSRGSSGLPLSSLCSKLTPIPSGSLKSSLWNNLLSVPTLQFIAPGYDTPLNPADPGIQRFEDAEKLGLKIVGNDHLRDCFVGLYDNSGVSIATLQRKTLERLAVARENGVTQYQLAKEFGIEGNNYFYRVKNLECRKLVVRQPVIVKTKEADDGDTKIMNTNLIYLSRYAKQLDGQQRYEINKDKQNLETPGNVEESDIEGECSQRESSKDDMLVKDHLPAMRAICDRLEAANDKVLIVSDIKKSLGYIKIKGHKAWRYICKRLKDAGIVEEFDAKVNEKIERCLRLLKKLPEKYFERKPLARGHDPDKEQLVKFGRRFQQTDQLVELDIDHQIYDAIDAKKSEGATVLEVCASLGLDRKRNDSRLHNVFSRFGMRVQAENHKKTVAFRVWSRENSNPDESNAFLEKSKIEIGGNNISTSNLESHDVMGRSNEILQEYNHSTSEVEFATSGNLSDKGNVLELCCLSPEDGQTNHVFSSPTKVSAVIQEPTSIASDAKLVSVEKEMNAASSETALLNSPKCGPNQLLPYLPLTSDGVLREKRILERLQDEKFILEMELRRWLMSHENGKRTEIDRRTIRRILNKLQQQGQCKIESIYLPVVTKCTSDRKVIVVLHPSAQDILPELMDDIIKRHRSFRSEGSSKVKLNEPIRVLNDVTRTETSKGPKYKAGLLDAMRSNGFMLAKMVRAKLLHTFLWGHLSSFPGWDDALSTGSPKHSHTFLELESAMRFISIEIFLKVVGSSKKGDDIVEKSRRGLRLCDLPVEEQKQLMDTLATGRLSRIIDILRRLKLIRLIPGAHAEDGVHMPHSPMCVLELRPYMEEPPSMIAKSNPGPPDLRPRIRHDFILSNKEALDEYWNTLEYCYAAADPTAALHAFPGSVVPEVFHPRRWTSVPIMSTHQHAELRRQIVKNGFDKKISCEECAKIAKNLSLSLQQVLCSYYKYSQKHFKKVKRVANANEHHQTPDRKSPSKRKKSSESSSIKHRRVDTVNEQLVDQFMEDQECTPGELHAAPLPSSYEDDHSEFVEELGCIPDKKSNSTINQCTKPLPLRGRRFAWTDETDRQLLKLYTRQVAFLGPNGRMDWDGISDLPASREKCVRRVSKLKRNANFRNALKKFCNFLQQRYIKHLEKTQSPLFNKKGYRSFVRDHTSNTIDSNGIGDGGKTGFEENQWDDFSETSIRKAFENLILFKQMAKVQASQGAYSEQLSNLNTNVNSLEENVHKHDNGSRRDSQQRSRNYSFHQKFIKCLSGGTFVSTRVHKSLPVSNAVELLKLVFLNTSAAPEVQNHLAETLRRYSEHDLFAAFSYLREKKFLIGGDGDQPFVLSQQFLQSVSKSFFPFNTGKRAAKFSDWIHEREKDLMEGEIILTEELQCGDIFQLFALVSSGELSISPSVPDEGVGEVEDSRNSKRKAEDEDEHFDGDKSKRMKTLDGELISRKEKGFPGIVVLMHRSTFDSVQLLNNEDLHVPEVDQNDKSSDVLGRKIISESSQCKRIPETLDFDSIHVPEVDQNDKSSDVLGRKIISELSQCERIPETLDFDSINPTTRCAGDSPWEAMMDYAQLMLKSDSKKLSLFSPETFRTIYMAIQKAGDQGLSLEEVSQVVGENMHVHVIDILQGFGYVMKVNTYDSVHVVDSLFRSKYFLTSGSHQELGQHSITKFFESIADCHSVPHSEISDIFRNSSHGTATTSHRVTILNRPEEVVPDTEPQSSNAHEGCPQENVFLPKQDHDRKTLESSSNFLHVPILPWVNGNGSINRVVYNGLVRRVLSIVMQNPGILEENIIQQIDVLNPESCRGLLDLMILDKNITVRKMHQSVSSGPPSLLGSLFESSLKKSKSVYRNHLFANPMSASLL
ncbi:B-block binding subunit of TFIIIC [Euphorbia peplus]|nr:B-block binding subunit of TFIIIC [Euphorbia peplus]